MKLTTISQADFQQFDSPRRLIFNEHSHQFACLNLGEFLGTYGLSWGSSQVEPILQVYHNILWIGIDQRLVAISLIDGNLSLSMPLNNPLFKILPADDSIAILTELEVILFNLDASLRGFLGLPDLAEDISFSGTDFKIKLFDGMTLTLNPKKPTFEDNLDPWDSLNIEEIAVDTGIEDLAENHDHYLYGIPKNKSK